MSKSISSRQPASNNRRPVATSTSRTKTTSRRSASTSGRAFHMPFEDKNMLFILIGVGIIGLGYFLMSQGDVMGFVSLTLAPIVLCIGYLLVVPYGIMYGARQFKKNDDVLVVEEQTISTPL